MQKRLKKYRPDPEAAEGLGNRRVTERSLQIIAYLSYYRFMTTSMLVSLLGGNQRVTHRHLQQLYQPPKALINRFYLPRPGNPGEFIYYLDNKQALKELVIHEWAESGDLNYAQVENNREKAYWQISDHNDTARAEEYLNKVSFIKHELMISHFHALLELACNKTDGRIEIVTWQQAPTTADKLTLLKPEYVRTGQRGADQWRDSKELVKVSVEPDAFFTIRFNDRPADQNESHFFYEADRKTTTAPKFNRKLRYLFHYIAKQKKHEAFYGVKRIRAVLVETLDEDWSNHLRESARSPLVSGNTPSPLFWFTPSTFFYRTQETSAGGERRVPLFLTEPEVVFRKIWATPADDQTLHSLLD